MYVYENHTTSARGYSSALPSNCLAPKDSDDVRFPSLMFKPRDGGERKREREVKTWAIIQPVENTHKTISALPGTCAFSSLRPKHRTEVKKKREIERCRMREIERCRMREGERERERCRKRERRREKESELVHALTNLSVHLRHWCQTLLVFSCICSKHRFPILESERNKTSRNSQMSICHAFLALILNKKQWENS
jgi:hypothetical protein